MAEDPDTEVGAQINPDYGDNIESLRIGEVLKSIQFKEK
jgi:hypothetical protein